MLNKDIEELKIIGKWKFKHGLAFLANIQWLMEFYKDFRWPNWVYCSTLQVSYSCLFVFSIVELQCQHKLYIDFDSPY